MPLTTPTAFIDRLALARNYQTIKNFAPNSNVLAVLKANAYGHGAGRISKSLPQADAFGVARVEEALALRAAGIIQPVVLLEGFFSPDELPVLAVNNLETIVHNHEQLEAICQAKMNRPLKVWLKIDTGMHRLGIEPKDFDYYYQRLIESENVLPGIVLMSHLACADDIKNDATTNQLALFNELTGDNAEAKSMANSAAVCAWPDSHFQWVRPGLMLYGISPMLAQSAETLNLAPVMTMKSSLIAIREIEAGDSVGYGAAWVSDKSTTIGVVAIGYGDGYPRHADNGTPVLVNGRLVPLVGRVSMDMITVDLGPKADDQIGDIVTLWGEGLPIEMVAEHAQTIPYELLCNITQRVKVTFK